MVNASNNHLNHSHPITLQQDAAKMEQLLSLADKLQGSEQNIINIMQALCT